MKIGDYVRIIPEKAGAYKNLLGGVFLVKDIDEEYVKIFDGNRQADRKIYKIRFEVVKQCLVVNTVRYQTLDFGTIIGAFQELETVYVINGRRYLKDGFKKDWVGEAQIDLEQKAVKPPPFNVEEEISKWETWFNNQMGKIGDDGLCAYSILFDEGNGKTGVRSQITDICHARLIPRKDGALAVITDVSRKKLNADQFEYLDFILNQSHFSDIYIGDKNINRFKKNKIGVRLDVNRGSNAVYVAAILIRTIWEHPLNAKHWVHMVEEGIDPHVAMIFAMAGLGVMNGAAHHIFHVNCDVDLLKKWCKKGGFVDEGTVYKDNETTSYVMNVSASWLGVDPLGEGVKNSLRNWAMNHAKKFGFKIEERWGERVVQMDIEQLTTIARIFEKE